MPLPPGPGWPRVIQTIMWCISPYGMLARCHRQFGDVFTVRIVGNRTYVMISDPSLTRDVFAGFGNVDSLSIGNEELRPLLGDNSLLLLNGARHQHDRRLLAPVFRSTSLASYGPLVWEMAQATGRGWQPGDEIAVLPTVRALGISVIVAIVFGLREGPRFARLVETVRKIIEVVNGPMIYFALLQRDLGRWSPGGRIWKARDELYDLIDREIVERGRSGPPDIPNVLDVLLGSRDEHGAPRSKASIRDEIITILLAGHDPTTAAMAWALYWIHKTPRVAERVRAELAACAEHPAAPAALPYLDAVCHETLRLYPPVPATERITRGPVHVAGFDLPAGVHLAPCTFLTHQRADLFDDPGAFVPERFLGRRYPPSVYFPFGAGPRRCIGADFAPFQMRVTLASLMSRFEFALDGARRIGPVLRGATIAPSGRLTLRVTAARASSAADMRTPTAAAFAE